MLTKVARCTMVSANEGTCTLTSTTGSIVDSVSQSSNGADYLHVKQLHRYSDQIYQY